MRGAFWLFSKIPSKNKIELLKSFRQQEKEKHENYFLHIHIVRENEHGVFNNLNLYFANFEQMKV